MTDFEIDGFLSQETESYWQQAKGALEEVSSEAELESRKAMQQFVQCASRKSKACDSGCPCFLVEIHC
jgi:hypothetical protein